MSNEHINGCELPDDFDNLDENTQTNIINYLNHLNNIEVRAYGIAKCHLGTSFDLLRSNGFNNWLKENKK
jgi:hypothetical protein